MRILVTGSSGRLGRGTAESLAASGHRVVGVDRYPAGLRGVDERVADLVNPDELRNAIAKERIEGIVHLAAIAVPYSAPERDILRENTQLAIDVMSAAVELGVGRTLTASSPTVLGYGSAGWRPDALPLDESSPVAPAHAYALSKLIVEEMTRMFSRSTPGVFSSFRPCYVIAPEEWNGGPTQQGHTVRERLDDPALAAVSLFNYVDARDVGAFVDRWLDAPAEVVDGRHYIVGAADALARRPIAELAPTFAPQLGSAASALTGTAPAFSIDRARRELGWEPVHTWRSALSDSRGEVDSEAVRGPAAHA